MGAELGAPDELAEVLELVERRDLGAELGALGEQAEVLQLGKAVVALRDSKDFCGAAVIRTAPSRGCAALQMGPRGRGRTAQRVSA